MLMCKINKKIEVTRLVWLDQLRGFGIFLVVYGHNFPVTEKYIYSFHMPLFIFLAGFFHPQKVNVTTIVNRIKRVVVPYFTWSIILYIIWFFVGRNYGESSKLNLSPVKNFVGIFYAQGGRDYMDWGIPLWFLPSIFVTFIAFSFVNKIDKLYGYLVLFLLIMAGFCISFYVKTKMIWSLDVALVSLFFYGMGYYFRNYIVKLNYVYFIVLGAFHFFTFGLNDKIDMYRSEYGNILYFLLNSVLGLFFYVGLFKMLPNFKLLSYLGRNTITILATQIRAMTFIKLFMFVVLGISVFVFSEVDKLLLSIVQIILIIPVCYVVNKYFSYLNGFQKNK